MKHTSNFTALKKALAVSAFLLTLPCLPANVPAQETPSADFNQLYGSDLAALAENARLAAPDLPAAKSYAVNYSLHGQLARLGKKVIFNTADGRVFELKISEKLARRYDGRQVMIYAKAEVAEALGQLGAVKISEYKPLPSEVSIPPYRSESRPAHMLGDSGSALTVDNVRWSHDPASASNFDWSTAVVRPDLVKNVYFIKKPFEPEWIAAHSFYVFTFEDGGLTDAAGNKASALVLSIEAYLREGQEYSLQEGLKDKFGIVWQLSTWENYAARTAQLDKQRLIPYPVILEHAQKAALVREGLAQASVNREGEFYNTITNNCTNNLVILLNGVLPEKQRIPLWTIPSLVYNLKATMPVWVPPYLQKKGLLGPELPALDAASYPSYILP